MLASYTYTPAGLLDTASYGGRTLTNTWDADANRVGMNANGTGYSFVYDTTAGIPAVIEEHTETNTVYYIREPGGELIARVHPTEGIRYYHFDELGSTRLLTDANGTVTDRYAYDAYGSPLAHDRYTGSVNQPYQYVGQLGYYTHWMEPDFGLMQLGVRFYDAEVGRFTQRDPLAIDYVSDALYAGGDPAATTDPDGRKCRRFGKSPTVQKCISTLDKCIGKKYPFYNRAKQRLKDEIYMCDGDGHYLWIPPRYGESDCKKKNGAWKCTIWLYHDKFFNGDYAPCHTILHELLHIGNWPKSGTEAETVVESAASMLWFYLCDPATKCSKKPTDWGYLVDDNWVTK